MRARRTVAAIALVSAVTASGLLTACGPTSTGASGGPTPVASGTAGPSTAPTAAPTVAPTSGGTGGTPGTGGTGGGGATGAPVSVNHTGDSTLTISNGTSKVVMNGTVVDFGVIVRDLAWSPDGGRAAFIDGNGNLDTANPDGSGRVVVAHNPGGQIWSHPAWQVEKSDPGYGNIARSNLFFVENAGGTTRLMQVPTRGGTPTVLPLNQEAGNNVAALPQTGNIWVNGGGLHGTTVYANTGTGEVYIRDDYIRQQGSAVTNGSEPALIPSDDDAGLAFVRRVNGHDHIFVEHFSQGAPEIRDLTPNATTDYTEPAVSDEGTSVAARTPYGVVIIAMSGNQAPLLVSSTSGLPSFR